VKNFPSFRSWLLLFFAACLQANDGAAEVALGGIQLRKESRIAMVKERLRIGHGLVRVDYEFQNLTDQDITTEIAFPIPDYFLSRGYGYEPFDYFAVWVNDRPVKVNMESHAFLNGKDVTQSIRAMRLNVESFALWREDLSGPRAVSQIDVLPADKQAFLVNQGLVDPEDFWPQWTVKKTYHWTQTFPAKQVTRIVHNYRPAEGTHSMVGKDSFDPKGFPDLCADQGFQKAVTEQLSKRGKEGRGTALSWIKYILTTANTWSGPIGDFELIVDRAPGERVSFCWDSPVEKVGTDSFRAKARNFRPSKELIIYFLAP
jgi:hypothetical protein